MQCRRSWFSRPHPPQAVPLPLLGEGLRPLHEGERRFQTRRAKRCRAAGHCKSCSPSSALKPSPCRRRGTAVAVDEVSMDKNTHCCKLRSRSSNPAGRSLSPPRERAPAALRRGGGLEGFTPPHHYRRGQRLPADIRLPPAPRVSAGLRFAVRSLSEAKDREINKVRRLC